MWCTTNPEGGMLSPGQKIVIDIITKVCEAGHYTDKIRIHVEHSKTLTVTLDVYGLGTSIKQVPALEPLFEIGEVWTQKQNKRTIKLENCGPKSHALIWSKFERIKPKQQPDEGYAHLLIDFIDITFALN